MTQPGLALTTPPPSAPPAWPQTDPHTPAHASQPAWTPPTHAPPTPAPTAPGTSSHNGWIIAIAILAVLAAGCFVTFLLAVVGMS